MKYCKYHGTATELQYSHPGLLTDTIQLNYFFRRPPVGKKEVTALSHISDCLNQADWFLKSNQYRDAVTVTMTHVNTQVYRGT